MRPAAILTVASVLSAISAGYGGESTEAPARSAPTHFVATDSVQRILDQGGPNARLARNYIKYATDLVENLDALDSSAMQHSPTTRRLSRR